MTIKNRSLLGGGSDMNIKIPNSVVKPPNDQFCIIPWIHLHTWPSGHVLPCCVSDSGYPIGHVRDNTLEELWNSDMMKNIRKNILEGKITPTCSRCFMQEEMGSGSFRVSSNHFWNHRIKKALETTDSDGYNHDFRLNYWDFRFSNICNLRCRMCGPELSSAWYEGQMKMYGSSTTPRALMHVNDESKEDVFKYVDKFISEVEEIYFAGGEPLLMDESYQILEKLIKVGNTKCRLRYNTNFTQLKYKKWDAIELWKQFPKENVKVYASLDATGPIAEYVRKGSNWNKIEENIKLLHENNINVYVSSTVSLLTIFELPKLIDRMLELGITVDKLQMNNVLTFPDYYNINILPDNIKKEVVNTLDRHINSISSQQIKSHLFPNYEVFKKYLYLKPIRGINELHLDFKKYTTIKDNYRKESFVELYPYYKEWFESI